MKRLQDLKEKGSGGGGGGVGIRLELCGIITLTKDIRVGWEVTWWATLSEFEITRSRILFRRVGTLTYWDMRLEFMNEIRCWAERLESLHIMS